MGLSQRKISQITRKMAVLSLPDVLAKKFPNDFGGIKSIKRMVPGEPGREIRPGPAVIPALKSIEDNRGGTFSRGCPTLSLDRAAG